MCVEEAGLQSARIIHARTSVRVSCARTCVRIIIKLHMCVRACVYMYVCVCVCANTRVSVCVCVRDVCALVRAHMRVRVCTLNTRACSFSCCRATPSCSTSPAESADLGSNLMIFPRDNQMSTTR